MLLELESSQLVLVDYQEKLMPAIYESAQVLGNAVRLARMAQQLNVVCFGTEQNPSRLGPNSRRCPFGVSANPCKNAIQWCRGGFGRVVAPAGKAAGRQRTQFAQTSQARKRACTSDKNNVVVAGCEAHVCLLQTALHLLEDGFDVWVVTDACGSRSERNRDAAFDRLAGAGVELLTTEMVAFEWLRSAEHPQFKTIQSLIK
jgi:nicotinamidase-related amidase